LRRKEGSYFGEKVLLSEQINLVTTFFVGSIMDKFDSLMGQRIGYRAFSGKISSIKINI
jgi:hypothetical protein